MGMTAPGDWSTVGAEDQDHEGEGYGDGEVAEAATTPARRYCERMQTQLHEAREHAAKGRAVAAQAIMEAQAWEAIVQSCEAALQAHKAAVVAGRTDKPAGRPVANVPQA